MKTKDSLRRKKGTRRKKKKEEEEEEERCGQRLQRREEPGLCSHFMMSVRHTHQHTHSSLTTTFSELLHKSWQGPSPPSDLLLQRLVWPHWSFQQVSIQQLFQGHIQNFPMDPHGNVSGVIVKLQSSDRLKCLKFNFFLQVWMEDVREPFAKTSTLEMYLLSMPKYKYSKSIMDHVRVV